MYIQNPTSMLNKLLNRNWSERYEEDEVVKHIINGIRPDIDTSLSENGISTRLFGTVPCFRVGIDLNPNVYNVTCTLRTDVAKCIAEGASYFDILSVYDIKNKSDVNVNDLQNDDLLNILRTFCQQYLKHYDMNNPAASSLLNATQRVHRVPDAKCENDKARQRFFALVAFHNIDVRYYIGTRAIHNSGRVNKDVFTFFTSNIELYRHNGAYYVYDTSGSTDDCPVYVSLSEQYLKDGIMFDAIPDMYIEDKKWFYLKDVLPSDYDVTENDLKIFEEQPFQYWYTLAKVLGYDKLAEDILPLCKFLSGVKTEGFTDKDLSEIPEAEGDVLADIEEYEAQYIRKK